MFDDDTNEEVVDQDSDAMAAFDEAVSDEPATPDVEDQPNDTPEDTPQDTPEDKSGDDQVDDTPDDKGGEKPPDDAGKKKPDKKSEGDEEDDTEELEEGSPEWKLKKRAKELGIKDDEDEDGDEPDPDKDAKKQPSAQPSKEPEPPKVQRLTKENVASLMSFLSDDEIPEGDIILGDDTVNLAEFKKNDPEGFNANKLMSGIVVKNMIESLFKAGYLLTPAHLDEVKEDYDNRLMGLSWWQDVMIEHPDAPKLSKDDNFKEWLQKQPKSYRVLADGTPDDAINIISLYKEHQSKKEASKHDDKLTGKKKKHDDLHKANLKRDTKPPSPGLSDENDAEKAFDEEAAKDD